MEMTGLEREQEERRLRILERQRREQFFTNLLRALRPSLNGKAVTYGTFAACSVIKPLQGFSLASFRVGAATKFKLPLPASATSRLRNECQKVRFGNVEPAYVQRSWQIDASEVSFPGNPTFVSEIFKALAAESVVALGLDGARLQLEARLSKLLFYEAGSHLPCHTYTDTVEEEGVFAILLLQLPTEEGYEGGKIVVKRSNRVQELDCRKNLEDDSVSPRLLTLCARSGMMLEDTLRVIQLLSEFVWFHSSSRRRIGVRNAEVAKAIAAAAKVCGWELLSRPVIDLAKQCASAQGESFLVLADQLACIGQEDAGALVAQAAIGVIEARIAERSTFFGGQLEVVVVDRLSSVDNLSCSCTDR